MGNVVHKTIEARTIGELEREIRLYPNLHVTSFSQVNGKFRVSLMSKEITEEE